MARRSRIRPPTRPDLDAQDRPVEAQVRRARLFWTGRSQAVRLPKEFRFEGGEVTIYREGDRVVLEPVAIARDERGWPLAWWELAGALPDLDLGDRAEPHERGDLFAEG